jgi:hypothetical protein
MKNKLTDLNDHLFAELERLSDEELEGDKLDEEIRRAEAVCSVSTQIISNGALVLKAEQFKNNSMSADPALPDFLTMKECGRK